MASSGVQQRRQHYFDLYSKGVGQFYPGLTEVFVCPLCRLPFDRAALDVSGVLTLEHCLSSKVGGTIETLTCGRCNNSHGSLLDSQLVNRHRSEDSMLGLSGETFKGTVNVAGVDVQARFTVNPDPKSIKIELLPGHSHPKSLQATLDELELRKSNPGDYHISFTWNTGYNINRFNAALLRAAYLMIFKVFGYRYVKMPISELILKQLDNPSDSILPLDVYIKPLPENFPVTNKVTVVRRPIEMQGLMVPIESSTEHRKSIHGVILPGIGQSVVDFDDQIRFNKSQANPIEMTFTPLPFDNAFVNLSPSEVSDDVLWNALIAINRP